jgi:hypothetical protein
MSAALAASAISSVATVQAEEENAQQKGNETERPVSIDEIPAPARDAILTQVGTGTLMQVVEETAPGAEPVYVGRISLGTRRVTVRVDAAGNILLIRRVL